MNTALFTCLIVEDDFASRKLLNMHLSEIARCDIAVDGEEAILAATEMLSQGRPYDLLCLDISLPGISGQEVLERIRQLEAKFGRKGLDGVKVIMTTMHDDPDTILTAFRSGCEAYLVKPIRRNSLFIELEKLGFPVGQLQSHNHI